MFAAMREQPEPLEQVRGLKSACARRRRVSSERSGLAGDVGEPAANPSSNAEGWRAADNLEARLAERRSGSQRFLAHN